MTPFRLLLAVFVLGTCECGWAGNYFLTIGGGPTPFNNQISLEKNVQFFQRMLKEKAIAVEQHDILFADGNSLARDLQYLETPDRPQLNENLALIFKETDHLHERYRNHEIENSTQAASRALLDQWFDKIGSNLTPADHLTIYVTAHGGRARDRKERENTRLYLWNNESIAVSEFAKLLDRLPEQLPVVMVMVQCHAGGFANLIFEDGSPTNKVTSHNRCGFFATVYDRPAAGCTPDIDEENYREYSSFFWAAIYGQTRTGAAIGSVDYNNDGVVTLSEAHAYVLLNSDTIDIPVTTSDTYLRSVRNSASRRPPVVAQAGSDEATAKTVTALKPVPRLTADSDIESLLAVADPLEQVVIEGISRQYQLTDSARAQAAAKRATALQNERGELQKKMRLREMSAEKLRVKVKSDLLKEWPELSGTWNSAGRELTSSDSLQLGQWLAAQPAFQDLLRLQSEIEDLEHQRLNLERHWAKLQRLSRVLNTVADAENLKQFGEPAAWQVYQQLKDREATTLSVR